MCWAGLLGWREVLMLAALGWSGRVTELHLLGHTLPDSSVLRPWLLGLPLSECVGKCSLLLAILQSVAGMGTVQGACLPGPSWQLFLKR